MAIRRPAQIRLRGARGQGSAFIPNPLFAGSGRFFRELLATKKDTLFDNRVSLAEATGFEPAIFGLTGRYVNRYTTPPCSLY